MKYLEIVIGTLTTLSFCIVILLTAVIKRCVDPDKVRQRADLKQLFAQQLLPGDILTPAGQRYWYWRNVLAIFTGACLVVIVVWQQILK